MMKQIFWLRLLFFFFVLSNLPTSNGQSVDSLSGHWADSTFSYTNTTNPEDKKHYHPLIDSSHVDAAFFYQKELILDSALYFFNKILDLCQQQDLTTLYYEYHIQFAFIYMQKQNYQQALLYALKAYNKALNPLDKQHSFKLFIILQASIELKKAEQVKWALDKIEQIGVDSATLPTYYLGLIDYYILKENYDSVSHYSEKKRLLEEKTLNQKNLARVSLLESKYKTAHQERQINLLNQEQALQAEQYARIQQQWWFLGLLIFLLIGSIIYWNITSKRLKQLNATKDKLFTIIGHDLKNPLMAFRAITQSLTQNAESLNKEETQYFIHKLDKSSNQLYLLIQNLLQWALNQSKSFKVQATNFSLDLLADEVFEIFKLNAEREVIELVNEIPLNSLVYGDPKMTQAILRNLVDNAIKFTPKHGTVRIASEIDQQKIIISVSDTGIGLSAADCQSIFDSNLVQKVHNNSSKKGLGFGLSLCQELAEYQETVLTIKSELGKGTTFSFTLNIAQGTRSLNSQKSDPSV